MSTYYDRKAAGLCTMCGRRTERTAKGYVHCEECEKKDYENKRKVREYRKANGLCIECGKPTKGRICPKCREFDRKRRELKKELQEKGKSDIIT